MTDQKRHEAVLGEIAQAVGSCDEVTPVPPSTTLAIMSDGITFGIPKLANR